MTEISHELSLELLKLEVRELEYIYISDLLHKEEDSSKVEYIKSVEFKFNESTGKINDLLNNVSKNIREKISEKIEKLK